MSAETSTSDQADASDVAVWWHWPVAAAAVLLGLFVWLFGDWLRSQGIHISHETEDWGHTAVVPFISGYFVYLNRGKILAQPFKTTWIALIPIVLGVAVYVATTIGPMNIRHFNLEGFGLWLTLFGLVLLFCGWRAMNYLWFPLVYLLIFGQKVSPQLIQNITFWMQDVTARGSHFVLALFVDVDRNGNTLYIFDRGVSKPLNIAEACSGMRMLMAFLALGVAMAYTGFRRFWQRAALVAMAVPTAIVVNVLRVVTLGLLSLADANFAAGEIHKFIGLIWLFPAFLIYLGLMWTIRQMVIEGPEHEEADSK